MTLKRETERKKNGFKSTTFSEHRPNYIMLQLCEWKHQITFHLLDNLSQNTQ